MIRKKIELGHGGIQPVLRGRWFTAVEKLLEVEAAIGVMRGAVNRIEFEAAWTFFVDSLEEFWTRFLDEGKTELTGFHPWVGTVIARRTSNLSLPSKASESARKNSNEMGQTPIV